MHNSANGLWSIGVGVLLVASTQTTFAAEAKLEGHELDTKFRIVHFDRDFETRQDFEQTALGVEIDYRSPQYFGVIGVGVSPYLVKKLAATGRTTEELFPVENGSNSDYAKFGQAYLNLTPFKGANIKLGWQKHKSMFLTSTSSRVVPNTFRGIGSSFSPMPGLTLHASVFDRWMRRSRNDSEGFRTDTSAEGDIDFVAIAGASYSFDQFKLEADYLESDDYLRKFGLRGTFTPNMDKSWGQLKFTGSVITSEDAGDLFVTGAEGGELDDEDAPGAVTGVTRSENDGLAGYIDAEWKINHFTAGFTLLGIDEIWIEDNFTGDHGTTPTPVTAKGQDLTNTGETVVGLRFIYDWQQIVPGLQTRLLVVHGFDAENSVNSALGTADENFYQVQVDYKPAFIKGLKFRALYQDYHAHETGRVDGVKADDDQLRVWLDYSIKFR